MTKKHSLALNTLFVAVLFSTFSINLYAQNNDSAKIDSVKNGTLQKYIDISSIPVNKRPKAYSELSAERKAGIFKLHLALQIMKRSTLSKEQKEVILSGVLMTTPEIYRKVDNKAAKTQQDIVLFESKSRIFFPGREGFEIFANIVGDSNDIRILQNYQSVTKFKYQSERRAAFRKLSAQERSDTMRVHLALRMAEYSLNKEQIDFIDEAASIMSPNIYSLKKGTAEWDRAHQSLSFLKERMPGFFTKEEAFNIFSSLGGEKDLSKDASRNPPNCSCSGQSDYCGWWREGAACTASTCRLQIGGCGTGLYFDCDGMCTGGL